MKCLLLRNANFAEGPCSRNLRPNAYAILALLWLSDPIVPVSILITKIQSYSSSILRKFSRLTLSAISPTIPPIVRVSTSSRVPERNRSDRAGPVDPRRCFRSYRCRSTPIHTKASNRFAAADAFRGSIRRSRAPR